MDVSPSASGEAKGGSFGAGGCSSLVEELFSLGLFSAEAAIHGFASSGVCSLGMSGAVVFCSIDTVRATDDQREQLCKTGG